MPKKVFECGVCGKLFEDWPSTKRRYCSIRCQGIAFSEAGHTHLICKTCGKEFKVHSYLAKQRKFCSFKCYTEYRRSLPSKKKTSACKECGKLFEYYPDRSKPSRGRYCSLECKYLGHSRVMKGIPKISKKWGPRNPNWKGVYTTASSLHTCAKKMVTRLGIDECAVCGWKETYNDICHIVPIKEGGEHSLENAVLLCPNHHRMYDLGLIPRESIQGRHLATLIQEQQNLLPVKTT